MGAIFRPDEKGENEGAGKIAWAELVPAAQWKVYEKVMIEAEARGIRFAVGGGFAFSHYARRWRNTKDVDLYVLPAERGAMVDAVRRVGLADYFSILAYDRGWIYRSYDPAGGGDHAGDRIIVDIMWQMANYRAQVDEAWLGLGDTVEIHGREVRMLPVEELLWSKLYILQRDRCDWGDLLNILYASGGRMDWARLIARVGEDVRVLRALMEVFTWACPGRAGELPEKVWGLLGMERATRADVLRQAGELTGADAARLRLLDGRDWFGPPRGMLRAAAK